jgi:putative FmdB family regulatory protein
MPLYSYECQRCNHEFEAAYPLSEYDTRPDCPECAGPTTKLMTLGGIQDDHPVWLDNSIRNQIQDTDDPSERPITTRTEYNQYLKDNGIVAD